MNGPVVLGIFFILGVCAIFVTMFYYNRNKEGFKTKKDSKLEKQVTDALNSWITCTGKTNNLENRHRECKRAIEIMKQITDNPKLQRTNFEKDVGKIKAEKFRIAVLSVGAIYEGVAPYYAEKN